MSRLLANLLMVTSWALLAHGAACVYPPAGWVVLGACLWIDLYLGYRLRGVR